MARSEFGPLVVLIYGPIGGVCLGFLVARLVAGREWVRADPRRLLVSGGTLAAALVVVGVLVPRVFLFAIAVAGSLLGEKMFVPPWNLLMQPWSLALTMTVALAPVAASGDGGLRLGLEGIAFFCAPALCVYVIEASTRGRVRPRVLGLLGGIAWAASVIVYCWYQSA